jgi:hypothetical protein
VVHEDVDRTECLADRLEPLPDLVDVREVGPYGESLSGAGRSSAGPSM